jgi:hypothetical protein
MNICDLFLGHVPNMIASAKTIIYLLYLMHTVESQAAGAGMIPALIRN